MPTKKILVALLIIVVAIGGFVAGLVLLQERQEFREEASTPTGTATVSLRPDTGDFDVGDTINTSVYFNPAGAAINGVAVRLVYPYTGASPEVTVSSIEVNSSFLSSGDWACPVAGSALEDGNVVIDISCAYTSTFGFTENKDVLLADISLNVVRTPDSSPFVIIFDSVKSMITRLSDSEDILLTPTGSGSFTIAGSGPTSTPTTGVTGTVTPSPTSKLTATPTITGTITPTPVGKGGELPDAGVSLPTVFGVSLGILVIAGAVLLAL